MKKILLTSVVFFSISHQAYAWDWLDRQINALPEMPRMSSLSKMYGMDKKVAPSDMVVKEDKNPAPASVSAPAPATDEPIVSVLPSGEPPVISGELPAITAQSAEKSAPDGKPVSYYRPADKTISGEERIVLQDDAVTPPPPPVPQENASDEDFVIRSSDVLQEKHVADDVVISSSEKGPLPPPAVINVVKGNKESAAKEKIQVNKAAVKPATDTEQDALAMPAQVVADNAFNEDAPVLPTEENVAAAANIFATFGVCTGKNCSVNKEVSITRDEWLLITRAFNIVPISTADRERTAISIYIGEAEKLAATKTGVTGAGSFDSADEAKNTAVYLKFLNNLRFHDIGEIAGRGFYTATGGWPHQTATIVEKDTGKVYAVDSSFEDNGKMAHIVLLDEWKTGWSPNGTIEEQAVTSDMIAPIVPKVRAVK